MLGACANHACGVLCSSLHLRCAWGLHVGAEPLAPADLLSCAAYGMSESGCYVILR